MDVPLLRLLVVEAADEEHLLAEVGQRRQHLAQLHALPFPLAHHSLPWNPLPAKSTARRTGAALAFARPRGSSPQTLRDSIQGNAIETPRPRSMVRRENRCVVMADSSRGVEEQNSIRIRRLASANLAELPAPHDQPRQARRSWSFLAFRADCISASSGSSESCTDRPRA